MNTLNELIKRRSFWYLLSFAMLSIYLAPLFVPGAYFPVYDNLDSNVVWYKILAHSGKIFAPNHAIIPNMMDGLPRLSYGSEFDFLLWLYVLFPPKVAYLINEISIHLIAFFGTLVFLSAYIVPRRHPYRWMIVFSVSIYYALIPFWSGSGATIATLPWTTYILLEIKNGRFRRWHPLALIFIVSYGSLVFMYLFYIGFAYLYLIYDALRHRHFNARLFWALSFFALLFVIKDYRLFEAFFSDHSFVSHRVEFDVFFDKSLYEVYRAYFLQAFLIGNYPHLHTLQHIYLLPFILFALLLTFKRDTFNERDSLFIILIAVVVFAMPELFGINIVDPLLTSNYTLPVVLILSIFSYLKAPRRYRLLPIAVLTMMFLTGVGGLFHYKGFHWIVEYIPLLKSFNMTRLYFVLPLLLIVTLAVALRVVLEKIRYAPYLILLLLFAQMALSLEQSFYQTYPKSGYLTFDEYYDNRLFDRLKEDILRWEGEENLSRTRVISYGFEPAVTLYNGFYTVDGYSTNYPLSYKRRFRKTQAKELLDVNLTLLDGNRRLYDKWGSKLYLLAINSEPQTYRYFSKKNHKVPAVNLLANSQALCDLGASYIISAYPLKRILEKGLKFKKSYRGNYWKLWMYKIQCKKKSERNSASAKFPGAVKP